jgi:glucose/arabinose dehydrogenase/PKD repeat protein
VLTVGRRRTMARRGAAILACIGLLLALAGTLPGTAQPQGRAAPDIPNTANATPGAASDTSKLRFAQVAPIQNPFGPTLPLDFIDTVVAEVPLSTGLAFLPDGRLLVSAKAGRLYLVAPGGAEPHLLLDLSEDVCDDVDRGMSGVAVDHEFATNGFVYLYYTFDKHGGCETRTEAPPVNRAVRYVLAGDTIDPASAVFLLDDVPTPGGYHEGGDMHFGPDGYLYIAVGDGGCSYAQPSLCQVRNTAARDANMLNGKILRITRDGDIPPTNPYAATGDHCRLDGGTSPGHVCAEIFATGFRNPFRFAIDPNPDRQGGDRIFVNDVGNNDWEEVNELAVGGDYGWNVREATCRAGGTVECGPPPAGFTDPIYAYHHDSGCKSITGAAFVPDGIWPVENDGAYLFADYVCGTIFRLDVEGKVEPFATGLGAVVSMTFGPDPEFAQALFYAKITDDGAGEIHRLAYGAGANLPPYARAAADRTSGLLPLTVTFDASTSSDPDNDDITFEWDFGDGSPRATGPAVDHTYRTAGTYTATLTVADTDGGRASQAIRIDAGNTPPTPQILEPGPDTHFATGDTIVLEGRATDAQDGDLPPSALSWEIVRHHDTHTHPFLSATPGNGVTFVAPEPEDLLAVSNSYLEIVLTATDSNGLSATVRQRLDPLIVTVTMATDPPGLIASVNGVATTGPAPIPSWAGAGLDLTTDTQGTPDGPVLVFAGWSDGGAASHRITTPPDDLTVTARFDSGPLMIPASAAARVDAVAPNENFSGGQLRAIGRNDDTNVGPVWTYIRFDVGGVAGTPLRATLWLYADNGSRLGPAVWTSADANWPETGITWDTRPARSPGIVAESPGVVPQGGWVAYDVTAVVTGNGVYSFVLVSDIRDGVTFSGRHDGDLAPVLVIDAPAGDGTGGT